MERDFDKKEDMEFNDVKLDKACNNNCKKILKRILKDIKKINSAEECAFVKSCSVATLHEFRYVFDYLEKEIRNLFFDFLFKISRGNDNYSSNASTYVLKYISKFYYKSFLEYLNDEIGFIGCPINFMVKFSRSYYARRKNIKNGLWASGPNIRVQALGGPVCSSK